MSPVVRHTPMFRVWCLDLDETERLARDFQREYGAHDAANAARLYCAYKLKELDSELWPVTVRVRELDTNKLFDVVVGRTMIPEYHPGIPTEVT